jgi:hypothetical protein
MQTLLNAIQEFEKWSGIPVNALKTKQMTVDGIEANREIVEELTYHGKSLPIAPESESVRYLGFWASPNGNMQAAKELVYDRTLRAKEAIQGHPLDHKQEMATFSAKAVGNFRYLAAITPWRQRKLDRLDRYWRQGFKTAWRLNEGTADHPWTTPKNMAGMGYTSTLTIFSHALHAHVETCMKIEDVVCQMMRNDLDRAMKDWRCTSKEELTAEAEARSWDETIDNECHVIHKLSVREPSQGEPYQVKFIIFFVVYIVFFSFSFPLITRLSGPHPKQPIGCWMCVENEILELGVC